MWTGGWYRGIVPAAVMIGMTAQPGEKQNRQGSRNHAPARIEGKIGHLSDDRFFLCVPVPVWGWVASGQKHTRVQIMVVAVPVWGWVASHLMVIQGIEITVAVPVWGWVASRMPYNVRRRAGCCCPRVGVGCIWQSKTISRTFWHYCPRVGVGCIGKAAQPVRAVFCTFAQVSYHEAWRKASWNGGICGISPKTGGEIWMQNGANPRCNGPTHP